MSTKRKKDVSTAEHPGDRADQTLSIDASHVIIDAFCMANREALVQLVLTYSDAAAEEKFHALREKFWSSKELADAERAMTQGGES